MKERGILFSAPMVRAILENRKTQTRRVAKHRHFKESFHAHGLDVGVRAAIDELPSLPSPYGQPGDMLWVRETWARASGSHWKDLPHTKCPDDPRGWETVYYRASYDRATPLTWRPSIFMPKWASRIWLEVTGVRVERLQDISEEDAMAEGIRHFPDIQDMNPYGKGARWSWRDSPVNTDHCLGSARTAYGNLWEHINGAGSWEYNPWVWKIEFRRAERKSVAA